MTEGQELRAQINALRLIMYRLALHQVSQAGGPERAIAKLFDDALETLDKIDAPSKSAAVQEYDHRVRQEIEEFVSTVSSLWRRDHPTPS